MRRYALRDDQWDRLKDFLPGREGHVGGTAADNRLFVEAVLFRYRAGIPWRDLPERFGDWKIGSHCLIPVADLERDRPPSHRCERWRRVSGSPHRHAISRECASLARLRPKGSRR